MKFIVNKTRNKKTSIYRSLYIKEELAKKVEEIAIKNDTSFNNVVISMIEYCLKEIEKD